MNPVAIIVVIVVTIVAAGVGFYYVFPYSFDNFADNTIGVIEEQGQMISKSVSSPVSSAINSASTTISPFKINTSCQLAYFLLENQANGDIGKQFPELPELVDQWGKESLGEVWHEKFPQYSKNEFRNYFENPDNPESQKIIPEIGYYLRTHSEELTLMQKDGMQRISDKLHNWLMETYSINPVLRDDVRMYMSFTAEGRTLMEQFKTIYLIDLDKYQEDIQCGRKYHEKFGDEVFNQMKMLSGEEWANKRHQDIQQILYG